MARARNLQVLTDQLKAKRPGVVIYGIGDAAHKTSPSDHNEDDTSGGKPEQTDADNNPEHRAIDVMIGPNFSKTDAVNLKNDLVSRSENKSRLKYVILFDKIYSAKRDFAEAPYSGDFHNHVHVSGNAADDENEASWTLSSDSTPPPPAPSVRDLYVGLDGDDVRRLQQFLRDVFPDYRRYVTVKRNRLISVDGDFGPQTRAWVIEFQRRTNLSRDGIVGPKTRAKLSEYGYKN